MVSRFELRFTANGQMKMKQNRQTNTKNVRQPMMVGFFLIYNTFRRVSPRFLSQQLQHVCFHRSLLRISPLWQSVGLSELTAAHITH